MGCVVVLDDPVDEAWGWVLAQVDRLKDVELFINKKRRRQRFFQISSMF
jgi:hypothetical protein